MGAQWEEAVEVGKDGAGGISAVVGEAGGDSTEERGDTDVGLLAAVPGIPGDSEEFLSKENLRNHETC